MVHFMEINLTPMRTFGAEGHSVGFCSVHIRGFCEKHPVVGQATNNSFRANTRAAPTRHYETAFPSAHPKSVYRHIVLPTIYIHQWKRVI